MVRLGVHRWPQIRTITGKKLGVSEGEIDLEAFAAEGRAIARAVKAELPDWSIVYFDEAEAARAKYQGAPTSYEIEIS